MTRTALVTGSVGGLGLAIAECLAAAGYRVALNGLAPQDEGERIAGELAQRHDIHTEYFGADLSRRDRIEALVSTIEERLGAIDVLVNNAVVRHFAPVDTFDPDSWQRALDVNLTAPFHLARLLIAGMKDRGWGRIVNIASYYGYRGAENRIDYVTTKTALLGMTRALAIECAKSGITANAVCPGSVGTEAILGRIRGMADETGADFERLAESYAAERNPMGRFVAAESVGAMVAFLCSDAGRDISGAIIPVDGGWLAR
ncbi:SDR family oxidoreductase [Pararhodobacter sp. SW119]|uniref:SDR family oxidoreductase n=1 Tax=Pararhodobacter sp. SW119 TaxID=2780075 RepID=UPI001ADF1057|nr:SDR family oxidoreductase [Pararhodobacter sp. SW119]